MANRNYTPVMFGLEKNIVHLYARVVFGPSGVPVLDTTQSKGICAVKNEAVSFTGWVTNSTDYISSVSTLAGLYTGMRVWVAAGGGAIGTASVTIGTVSGDLYLSKQSITSSANQTLVASNGRISFQFGSKEAQMLDSYNKLLNISTSWGETVTNSSSGTATVAPLAPSISSDFLVKNLSNQRTVPNTLATASTDCTISLQLGTGLGTSFVAANPQPGEVLRVCFTFGNSSAI